MTQFLQQINIWGKRKEDYYRLKDTYGEGHGNPLQYSCLENPMDRGAWQATVRGVTELDTTEQLQCHFLSFDIIRDKLVHIE